MNITKISSLSQVTRINAKSAFVEVVLAQEIGKIKIGFVKYDAGKEEGKRATAKADCYLSMDDAGVLASKIRRGRLASLKKGTAEDLYVSPSGGTSKDGICTFRNFKIQKAERADYLIAGYTGPGKQNERGLIMPDGKLTGIYVPVKSDNLEAFGLALERCIRRYDAYVQRQLEALRKEA